MQRPNQSHMDSALRIVRYLKGVPGLGIFLPLKTSQQWQLIMMLIRGIVLTLGGQLLVM